MHRCVPAIAILLAVSTATAADAPRLAAGLRALGEGEATERLRGVGLLAACRDQPERGRAAQALQRALFDAEATVRRGAVGALADLDARAAGGDIVRLLQVERDVHVLPAALLALGTLHVAGCEPVLTRFASHPDAAVRAAALTAAGDLGGPAMRRLILNSLQMAGEEDPAWLVRSSAVVALARVGQPADLAAIEHAYRVGGGESQWLARAAVARAVARLNPRPQAALERLLADADPRVAVTAARGLADAGLAGVLLGHLQSGASGIRAAAVGGVRQADLRQAAPQLRRMARLDGSLTVRWAAATVLFAWDDALGDELLLDALRSKEPGVWAEALALLAAKTGARHGRDVEAWRETLRRHRAPR